MNTSSELGIEHRYTQILRVQKSTEDVKSDIYTYISDVLNKTGILFYKAHLYKAEENDACRFIIEFYLFSSNTLYWNHTVLDNLKTKYLNKLLEKWNNIKLIFEDATEMIHEEKKKIADVEDPDERGLGNISGRNFVHKFFNWWLIVPRVQWDFFDLPYQLYSFDIFHQYYLTKLFHFFTVPTNAMLSMCFLAQFDFGMKIGYAAFSVDAALIILLLLIILYLIAGIVRKAHHWSYVTVAILIICWMSGNLWYHAYKTPDNPWYNPTTTGTNPLLWSYISGLIQALSHTLDPQIPPYITGMSHWETFKAFLNFRRDYKNSRFCHYLSVILSFSCAPIFPTTVAWMSWPHLLGVEVLCVMVNFGYKPEAFEKYLRVVEKAKLSGNPVLDVYPSKAEDLLHKRNPHVNRPREVKLVSENTTRSEVVKSLAVLRVCDHFFGHSLGNKEKDLPQEESLEGRTCHPDYSTHL